MKKSINYFMLSLMVLGLFAFISNNTEEKKGFHEPFAAILENAKAYTLEVAEKMPAEDYSFKPHDSVRSFREQMAHIAMSSKLLITTLRIKGHSAPSYRPF